MARSEDSTKPEGESHGAPQGSAPEQVAPDRLHFLHFGFESEAKGRIRLPVDDAGIWTQDQVNSIADKANLGAVKEDPSEILRFIGSFEGRALVIRNRNLANTRLNPSEPPLRRGSWDTWVAATRPMGSAPAPSEMFERRLGRLDRYGALRKLASFDESTRRAFIAQVTAAIFDGPGQVWLAGLPVPEQFDVSLAIFPWSFMERVEIVSHPDVAPVRGKGLGRLLVTERATESVGSRPPWLDAYVERLDLAITKSTPDFARQLDWLDEQAKFYDPKGFIQIVTAWFGNHSTALERKDRVALVLRQTQVPNEVRRRVCERLVERMAVDQDQTLLAAIEKAGKEWREADTSSPLADTLLDILADQLRENGFGARGGVLASQPLVVLRVLANASQSGLYGNGGGRLRQLLTEVVECAESVADGEVEDWIESLRAARVQGSKRTESFQFPSTCRRLVARIWREYASAVFDRDKATKKNLLARRKDIARLDGQLRIGDVDLLAVRHESDEAMLEAFERCRRSLGGGWMARALRLHAEDAQRSAQSVDVAVRAALGHGEHIGVPYSKAFFRELIAQFPNEEEGADGRAMRDAILRNIWARLRNRHDSGKIERRLRGEWRRAKLRDDVIKKLAREMPLPVQPPSWIAWLLVWSAALLLLLAAVCGVAYLVAPEFVLEHGAAAWKATLDLWSKAVAFVDGFRNQGEQK